MARVGIKKVSMSCREGEGGNREELRCQGGEPRGGDYSGNGEGLRCQGGESRGGDYIFGKVRHILTKLPINDSRATLSRSSQKDKQCLRGVSDGRGCLEPRAREL